jgi:hypothetical protein
VTDNPDELEVPDFRDASLECGARRQKPGVIGAPTHWHICRQFPDHAPPHTCHSCGATWSKHTAAA